MVSTHDLGVAPLSAITASPDRFIRAAHAAGFSSVGLRLMPVSATDAPFSLDLASDDFTRVQDALADTGVDVVDFEVLSVTPQRTRDDWLPMFEAGAALGASFVNVVCDNPSLDDFTETLAVLTADAAAHNIMPVLEPVAFRPLNSFVKAIEIARSVGCAVELDALHYLRTGADLATIRDNADIIPIFQLCDAPAVITEHADILRTFATDDSDTALAIAEARAYRLLPGEGAAPIHELLAVLADTVRVSVEIPNTPLRGDSSTEEYLALLHDASARYLTAATR